MSSFMFMGRRFALVMFLLTGVIAAFAILGFDSLASREAAPVRHAAPSRAEALARLVSGGIPARNLYTLANELALRPPRDIPRVVRRVSPNYPVGHHDQFYVQSDASVKYFTMQATIRYETPHLYIYVQDGTKTPMTTIQRAAQTFEHSIYPTDRAFFGSEWRPGVDGDQHITCLVGDLKGASMVGAYSAEDEYPRVINRWSNEREMIYLDQSQALTTESALDQLLSHEFQHMIHWHMHPHDNAWLNEGMSVLAEEINHQPPTDYVTAFAGLPDTQLNTWALTGERSISHYGAAYLFLAYIYDRFGRSVIHDIVADKRYTDFAVIDDVFRSHHIHQTANGLFRQWVIANVLGDASIAHGIYAYKDQIQKVYLHSTSTVPFSHKGRIPPYAAQYVAMTPPKNGKAFRLQFSASSTIPLLDAPGGGSFWWSNRGDMSNTRMTRTVDLTGVHRATLRFRTWYDIEKDYDYAYVEASLDGGKTWTTLRGTHTSRSNPTGANYGDGYTGTSQGWVSERVNLTPYTGHRVKLRFQYITDDEFNGQGMAVKNISIPEIGLKNAFANWKPDGFVPVFRNVLPSTWTVQMVSYTDQGVKVGNFPLSGGKGSLLVDPAKFGLKKLIAVIYTTAPKTSVETTYTLSAGNP